MTHVAVRSFFAPRLSGGCEVLRVTIYGKHSVMVVECFRCVEIANETLADMKSGIFWSYRGCPARTEKKPLNNSS